MPVLEEEEYLEKLEKVIKRDFYPELHKIEYLMNPEQKELDEKDKDLQLSLNRFIQRVKSEDNEILREIKEKEEKNWKQKLWWMFLAEKKEKELSNAIEAQRYYDPVKKIQHDDSRRLALPQFTGKNSLFFPGEGLKRQLKDQDEINKKKKIFYENTRLDYQQLLMQEQVQEKKKEKLHSLEVLNTPALIGLHKQLKEDDKNYDLNKLKNGSLSERSEISQINGYSLVEVPSYDPKKRRWIFQDIR
ncbi:hypothetical protein PPERSA_09185 [Pseudocohnilembus persalinus]|uniref:Uncharacterized protein n=1 Tax=Pseudocohnilembus persalinus TaxID=266149 RepID=A0A0V0QM31_PSEPJ|nr:hypothetical protein PPERSA_09185 [Pseudocohnilembus persalinus]|eukprot:KRX03277.1 hypothetical protein PPERSA_09185 [Pseudocohnilembus persalinus]